MGLQADKDYLVTIIDAGISESKERKTPSIHFRFECEEGAIEHDLYITPKTIENLGKTLRDAFGIQPSELTNQAFLEGIGGRLIGRECRIVTISEPYNGKEYVKVRFVNNKDYIKPALTGDAAAQVARRAASIFSGSAPTPATEPVDLSEFEGKDDGNFPF